MEKCHLMCFLDYGRLVYVLGAPGATGCPTGTSAITSFAECLTANVAALPAGNTIGRPPGWSGDHGEMASGCGTQSGGDWTAHFNTLPADAAPCDSGNEARGVLDPPGHLLT